MKYSEFHRASQIGRKQNFDVMCIMWREQSKGLIINMNNQSSTKQSRAGEAELKKIEDDVRSASRHIADNLGAQHHADASSESN